MQNDLLLNAPAPSVDPRDFPTVKCDKCGSILFKTLMVLKEIPGTVVGQGSDTIKYPMGVLVCEKCGAILKDDIKTFKLENDITENNKTGDTQDGALLF